MPDYSDLASLVQTSGIEYIVSVPCSETADLLLQLDSTESRAVSALHEEQAIGILAGLELSGRSSLGVFQDTALGNSGNILSFLAAVSNISLRLWLGSRTGTYLLNNPAHWLVKLNRDRLLPDGSFIFQQVTLPRGTTDITLEQLQIFSRSLRPPPGSSSILFIDRSVVSP